MKTTWAILWRTILFFVAFALLSALFIVPIASRLSGWEETSPVLAQLYPNIVGLLTMLVATWIMTRFVDRRPFPTIGFLRGHVIRDVGFGLVIGVAWLTASVGIAWLAGWASPKLPESVSVIALLWAGIAVFSNVLTQQLLLCGYIYQTIRSRTNFALTLFVSAALFSAYHAGAFQGAWLPVVNVFATGALFCFAYEVTGNLWLSTAVHFAWNFLLGPALGLTVSGTGELGIGWSLFTVEGPALFTGGAFGLEGGMVVTLTTLSCVVALALFRVRRPRVGSIPTVGTM